LNLGDNVEPFVAIVRNHLTDACADPVADSNSLTSVGTKPSPDSHSPSTTSSGIKSDVSSSYQPPSEVNSTNSHHSPRRNQFVSTGSIRLVSKTGDGQLTATSSRQPAAAAAANSSGGSQLPSGGASLPITPASVLIRQLVSVGVI